MTTHDQIIPFLSSGEAFGLGSDDVSIQETHGALVFLTPDEAWKIKKPVKFDYMDFSTLERRGAACRREIEINQPNAPQIYLGLVPVTRESGGTLALGGEGYPVEWAVHMRRFPDDALFTEVARDGRLTDEVTDRLCAAILTAHQVAPAHTGSGFAEARAQQIIASLNAAFSRAGHALPDGLAASFAKRTAMHFAHCRDVLKAREAAGFVRRCHGDLHLRNIVLLDGEPVLFDAIEFSEDLATIDVLYDLAFLLMDLCHEGLLEQANRLLNSYLRDSEPDEASMQIDGLAALPLFIAMRAGVRAMVLLDRAAQHQGSAAEADRAAAIAYLERAVAEVAPSMPHLVAIGGYSGTGKTTVARRLAPGLDPCPGALHLRTDVERKLMAGVNMDDRLPPESYTKQASDKVYAAVLEKARAALRAGWPVIVDAAFLDRGERDAVEQLAGECGTVFTGLWLEADEEVLVERVTARRGDASDATANVVRQQLSRGAGDTGWARVDAGGKVDATVSASKAALSNGG
jgi:aminoglycoside phosphotransferase family enzyme/predicted kinase